MSEVAGVEVTERVEGDFWKGVPLARPLPLVTASRDRNGDIFYILPPCPGGQPWSFGSVYDIVKHPARWANRSTGAIAGSNRDTHAMNLSNAHRNERMGMEQDWSELWERERGKTAIIIATGPSLTQSLPEIAYHVKDRDRFFTIGFNRAHRAMDLDYFVSLDRVAQPDWITRDTGETKLIASTCSNPDIAAQFADRYWGENFLDGIDYGFSPLRTLLGLSLPEAMFAAYKLGAKEIWLYGADFALSGVHVEGEPPLGGYHLTKYYFDTVPSGGLKMRTDLGSPAQLPVRGIHGKMVFINYELWANASWVTAMCMMLDGVVPVRNKSRAGILFWGVDEKP
ncbi:MAG: 6-hydroxymethylpterin diphosphokinase MptE-like protein [Planctomycetota bacterium]